MYEILPHTADMVIRVTATTREDVLRSLIQGMFAAAEPREVGEERVERSFAVIGANSAYLVVDFLNVALAESDVRSEAYDDVRFDVVTDEAFVGVLIGHPVGGFATQIKAATYHDLVVQTGPSGWEMRVTFDV